MPYKEKEITKLYYSISEVASQLNVNPSLIRFWEKEFDLIQPKKNKKGNRLFTQQDVDQLHTIYHLVKERGYTLQGAREKLKKDPEGVNKNVEITSTLQELRKFLIEIKERL